MSVLGQQVRIKPYILAGGKSSRMGRDKAMLELEGKTLLRRTVETLRSVDRLGGKACSVVIVGERDLLEGADRAIVDSFSSCGPLGGIEAALEDLQRGAAAEWAFFVPVDMPLLSPGRIGDLLEEWTAVIMAEEKSASPITACMVNAYGSAQPLVSLVHRSTGAKVKDALEAGCYKVLPLLQSGRMYCTFLGEGTARRQGGGRLNDAGRNDPQLRKSLVEFTNVNTEADLIGVATLLQQRGSNQ